MDESGDLGFDFNKKITNKFLITFLVSDNLLRFGRLIEKTFKKLPKNALRKHNGILHFKKEKIRTQKIFLQNFKETIILNNNNQYIATVILDKKNCEKEFLNIHPSEIFNRMTLSLLNKLYSSKLISSTEIINFYVSRRETNRILNKKFINYIQNNIYLNFNSKINVIIKKPHEIKSLQTVDALSFSIFKYQENFIDDYFNLLSPFIKIIEFYDLKKEIKKGDN